MTCRYFWIFPALLLTLQAHSQAPCYRLLFDGAGLNADRSGAAAQACAARDSAGSDFTVFSAVYYPPSRYFAGGFPDSAAAALRAQAAAISSAHLLLLWRFDAGGQLQSAGFELVLPPGGCLSLTEQTRLRMALQDSLQQPIATATRLVQRETAAIKALAEFLGRQRRCCAEGADCSSCTVPNDIFSVFRPGVSTQYGGVDTLPPGTVPPPSALSLRSSPNYSVVSFGPEAVQIQDRRINIQAALDSFAALHPDKQFHVLVLERNLQVCLDDALQAWWAKPGAKGVVWIDAKTKAVSVAFQDDAGTGVEYFLEDFSGLIFLPEFPHDISIPYAGDQPFYACLDYTGRPFVLPKDAVPTFKRDSPSAGALLGFSLGQSTYQAAKFPDGKFAGYYLKIADRPIGRSPVRYSNKASSLFSLHIDQPKCRMHLLRKTQDNLESALMQDYVIDDLRPRQDELQMEQYASAVLPASPCATEAETCRLYFQGHEYLNPENTDPISRVVQANPCLLHEITHYNFNGPQSSVWMDQFNRTFLLIMSPALAPLAAASLSTVLAALFEAAPVVLAEAQLAASAATSKAGVQKSREFITGFTVDVILQCAIIAAARGVEHIEEEIDLNAAIGSGLSNTISFGSSAAEQALAASVDAAANCLMQSLGASTRSQRLAGCTQGVASALISRAISNLPKGAIIQLGKLTWEQFKKLADWMFSNTTLTDVQVKGLIEFMSAVNRDLADGSTRQLDRLYALRRTSPYLKKAVSSLSGTLTPQAIADIEGILLEQSDEFFERLSRESGLAEAFVNDLKDQGLRAAMMARPELGRAWEVLSSFPTFRNQVANLALLERVNGRFRYNGLEGFEALKGVFTSSASKQKLLDNLEYALENFPDHSSVKFSAIQAGEVRVISEAGIEVARIIDQVPVLKGFSAVGTPMGNPIQGFQLINNNGNLGFKVSDYTANVRGTNFEKFVASVRDNFEVSQAHAHESFYYFKTEKWGELEALFKNNNLNGLWPPNEGFISISKTETGSQLVGKKFDRFQGPGGINGSFASPVNSNEDIENPFFTYDSRALKNDIREGTQYILFEIKSSAPSSLKFEYGDIIPWFGKQGLGDQVKSSMNFGSLTDHITILDTKTYINGQWQ